MIPAKKQKMAEENAVFNFEYCVPTRVVFGRGSIDRVSELIPKGARVLLLYGGGSIKRNGIYDRIKRQVTPVAEFGGIEANPDHETCLRAMELARKEKTDFLLAVGGGSVVDAAKYIAAGAAWTKSDNPFDILTEWGLSKHDPKFEPDEKKMAIGAVLTLPATGTEMNAGSVISWRAKHLKLPFNHPSCFPMWSVLDPETTYSLPKKQIANGIADAFVHVIEQYMPHFEMGLVQDEQSEAVMRSLVHVAPTALADSPPSYKARADFFWATTQALNGLVGLGVPQCWATHMIGHEITAYYGLDHGVTLAIVLPQLMRKLKPQRGAKFARMAERVFGVAPGSCPDMAEKCIEHIEEFFHSIGIKTKLSEYGCDASHLEEIAAKFEGRTLGPEKHIGRAEVLEILHKCM